MDKWLTHPTALKVISVVLGLLLWAVVHFDPESPAVATAPTESRVFEAVQVQTVGLDESKYALSIMEPTVVRVMVEGRLSALTTTKESNIIATVDLSDHGAGSHQLPVVVKLPKGLQLLELSPRTVNVQLEEIQTKPFALDVRTEGKPAEGYTLGTPVVAPASEVKVTLPRDEMGLVGAVRTVVKVEGQRKTVVDKRAPIVVYDRAGKLMDNAVVSPSTVEVEVPITQPSKTLPLQLSYTGKLGAGLSIASLQPSLEEVTVFGPQEVLDKLSVYDGASVDLSRLKEGKGSLKVKMLPLEGIELIEPAELDVNYDVVPLEKRTFTGIKITVKGLADGLKAKRSDATGDTVQLTVSGAPSAMAGLQAQDIEVIADLAGLEAGKHTVNLDVKLPRFIQLVDGSPLTAVYDISESTVIGSPPPDGSGGGTTPTPPTGGTGGSGSPKPTPSPGGDEEGEESVGPSSGSDSGSGSGAGQSPDPS
ncbi:YbbR-like domain-containing protein [Paenibacillus sp. GCM10023252]|uniref:CdaR family protein n=1 Tax=Paenibacillus sp. GCM10023252 TaxID=3252649 RepID=UPI003607B3C4